MAVHHRHPARRLLLSLVALAAVAGTADGHAQEPSREGLLWLLVSGIDRGGAPRNEPRAGPRAAASVPDGGRSVTEGPGGDEPSVTETSQRVPPGS